MINDWIYMCSSDSFGKIETVLRDVYDIEVWKELGVVEVNRDGSSIDFEIISENRWDDLCRELLLRLGYDSMYQVSLGKGSDRWAEDFMKHICNTLGGRFCADTEDLNPFIE